MEFETINYAVNEDIGIIRLNRPEKRNAISIKMRQEIMAALDYAEKDKKAKVIIFTGTGTVFSGGFDLDEFKSPDLYSHLIESSSSYHKRIWRFPKPTIAAINGPAVGGGFDLVTLCDIRICTDEAVFGHPEIKWGAPPLSTPLRWIVGEGISRYLCLTGNKIDANRALQIGLVSEIIQQERLMIYCRDMAASIMEAPANALLFLKQCFIQHSTQGFEEAFEVEHNRAFQEIIVQAAERINHDK